MDDNPPRIRLQRAPHTRAGTVLIQLPHEAPLFSSWGQVALFVGVVATSVGWLWKLLRAGRSESRAVDRDDLATERHLTVADLSERIITSSHELRGELAATRIHLHALIDTTRTALTDELAKTRHDIRDELQKVTAGVLTEVDKEFQRLEVAMKAHLEKLLQDVGGDRRRAPRDAP